MHVFDNECASKQKRKENYFSMNGDEDPKPWWI